MQFKIAIVDSNILACMGLERILEELIPVAEIVTCESFEELLSKGETEFVHYFVSSRIYFEHTAYFRDRSGHSIVMVGGDMTINGVATLNVCQGEAALVRDLVALQRRGHHAGMSAHGAHGNIAPHPVPKEKTVSVLSAREVRLMRRMLRDSRKRGTNAPATLNQWEKVVQNELLHIEPNRHVADMTINSSMPYELGVMRDDMIRLLSTLPECEIKERAQRIYVKANGIARELVPEGSVIREFIG
jgi:hypothetical protein